MIIFGAKLTIRSGIGQDHINIGNAGFTIFLFTVKIQISPHQVTDLGCFYFIIFHFSVGYSSGDI